MWKRVFLGVGRPARLAFLRCGNELFRGLGVPPDSPFHDVETSFLGGWASRPTRLSTMWKPAFLGVGRPARLAFPRCVTKFSGGWASRPTQLSPMWKRVFLGVGGPARLAFLPSVNGHRTDRRFVGVRVIRACNANRSAECPPPSIRDYTRQRFGTESHRRTRTLTVHSAPTDIELVWHTFALYLRFREVAVTDRYREAFTKRHVAFDHGAFGGPF
jgi:hypothetical protein